MNSVHCFEDLFLYLAVTVREVEILKELYKKLSAVIVKNGLIQKVIFYIQYFCTCLDAFLAIDFCNVYINRKSFTLLFLETETNATSLSIGYVDLIIVVLTHVDNVKSFSSIVV